MSIWLALWILLSLALMFFLVWTVYILFMQKKTWSAYAKKHKLRYRAPQIFGVPEISGAMGDYTINIFGSEHFGQDVRGSRKLTAIEVQLSSMLPVEAGIGNGGMVQIIEGFGYKEEMRPDHEGWDDGYVAVSENKAVLEAYLTKERLDALTELMKVENAWVILVFRSGTALLRFDTPDPLTDGKKLEALADKMLKAAAALELNKGESGKLSTVKATKRRKEVELKVDGKAMEAGGLTLEEDHPDEEDVKPEEPEAQDDQEEGKV